MKIAVIGLGYVGLPLAVRFAEKGFDVLGFDLSLRRVEELKRGFDRTGEVDEERLKSVKIFLTSRSEDLRGRELFIVTVPTPVDEHKIPDLSKVIQATEIVSGALSKGGIVVYESTVYPGVTEEVCVPILERGSGLKHLLDFNVGYSPERVNPGDKEHTLERVVKVVAGDTPQVTELLAQVYGQIIDAGVFKASSIRVAEAAKVIENVQRDLNIALMNELAILFRRMGIPMRDVLEAASTKWNFLKFHPGLVGGHCIGVDPYYLTYKAQEVGYHPEVILAGRRLNDNMGRYVAREFVKELVKLNHALKGTKALIMGFAFKENVRDFRNTKVIDIVRELREFSIEAVVWDPVVDAQDALVEYKDLSIVSSAEALDGGFCGIVFAVPHAEFKRYSLSFLRSLCLKDPVPVIFDVRWSFQRSLAEKEGFHYVSL